MQRSNVQSGDVKDTYRRFGTFGPAYVVRGVHTNGGGTEEADIELLESGEKLTLPLAEVLSCPLVE